MGGGGGVGGRDRRQTKVKGRFAGSQSQNATTWGGTCSNQVFPRTEQVVNLSSRNGVVG